MWSSFCAALIGDLMQQLDLFISVKPKKGQLQSVIVKSIEQNIHCIYRARSYLLDCSYQPTLAVRETTPTMLAVSEATPATLVSGTASPHSSSVSPTPAPRSPSPSRQCPSPQNDHTPSSLPSLPLKETASKVTFSREPTLISPEGELHLC